MALRAAAFTALASYRNDEAEARLEAMVPAAEKRKLSYAEYLEREAQRDVRHEFFDGEILSESTESFDREGKFKHYRSIPTFQEYVLVSYREPLIESHVRNADGSWNTTFAGPGETLVLRSIDARLEVDNVYAGMTRVDGRMKLP